MPIYEYECTRCGQIEEVIQKFSDKPLTKCNHCHGKLQKLVSQSSFHLKGTGWYVTDYANKSKSTSTAAKPKTSGDTSDSKPKKTKESSAKATS